MSVHEEDDFELVLGNRQLFFLAVVLFGVFFSIGYTVGYSRGRESADEVSAATRQPAPVAEPAPSLTPRDSLVPQQPLGDRAAAQADPASADPAAANRTATDSTRLSAGAAALAQSNSATSSKPQPTGSTSPASAARPPAAASTKPASAATSPAGNPNAPSRGRDTAAGSSAATPTSAGTQPRQSEPDTQATIAVPAIKPGAIYLQVLASREAGPAREALIEMRAKGHPVTLDNIDPAWYRILVGPFENEESAAQYQIRLKQEKIDSFIRKL